MFYVEKGLKREKSLFFFQARLLTFPVSVMGTHLSIVSVFFARLFLEDASLKSTEPRKLSTSILCT